MIKAVAAALAAVCLSATAADAQPFGITQGTPRASLDVQEEREGGYLRVKPPKAHPEFEAVDVTFTSAEGACEVTGIGITHANDRAGWAVRSAMAELRAQIDATYGRSRLIDFIRPRSLYSAPSQWVMAIRKGDRFYHLEWGNKNGPVIANGVVHIYAVVAALDHEDSWIGVTFYFANHKKCDAEIRQTRARAF